ncbi:MAG: hypothetical protein HP001_07615 [Oscillospiraceae bacterium]|nr:hypothetical protein [Oscillospiraceae bacterium]
MRKMLHCSYDKAIKFFNQLDVKNGVGHIEHINQGQNKPAKIHVKLVITLKKPVKNYG